MERSEEMQRDVDSLSKSMFGMTVAEARAQGICVVCKSPAVSFRDALSEKEYGISGMCQRCQDSVFEKAEHE